MNQIFELYALATEYMKSKNQVAWPEFSREMVSTEIKESRQWKLLIDNKIACIWATTLNDDLIWGANNDKAIYIHRIATNPFFRGRKLVSQIVNWAEQYCLTENLKFNVFLKIVKYKIIVVKKLDTKSMFIVSSFTLNEVISLIICITKDVWALNKMLNISKP